MKIDLPGSVTTFEKLTAGEVFLFFEREATVPSVAMKLKTVTQQRVLVFTLSIHPSEPSPTVTNAWKELTEILHVPNVVFRPSFKIDAVQKGSPIGTKAGPIVFSENATVVRAVDMDANRPVHVDLATGAIVDTVRGLMWLKDWVLALQIAPSGEEIIYRWQDASASNQP
jgi:hypothetical protein